MTTQETDAAYAIQRLDGQAARAAIPSLADILRDCVEGALR